MEYPPKGEYEVSELGIERSKDGTGMMYVITDLVDEVTKEYTEADMLDIANLLSVAYENLMKDGETHPSVALDFLWTLRNLVAGDEIEEKR